MLMPCSTIELWLVTCSYNIKWNKLKSIINDHTIHLAITFDALRIVLFSKLVSIIGWATDLPKLFYYAESSYTELAMYLLGYPLADWALLVDLLSWYG